MSQNEQNRGPHQTTNICPMFMCRESTGWQKDAVSNNKHKLRPYQYEFAKCHHCQTSHMAVCTFTWIHDHKTIIRTHAEHLPTL
jgi:hypothetical protein